jgi:hypothetical protein
MLTFSSNIQTALARDTIEAFYMLRILNYDNTVMYASTTYATDVQLLSSGVAVATHFYYSDGSIMSVDPPQLNTNVDREQYRAVIACSDLYSTAPQVDANTGKITLTNNSFTQLANTNANLVGLTIEGRLGFVNVDTYAPYLELVDTILVYKGRIDGVNYSIKTNEIGEALLQLTGSSPMRNLDRKKSIFLSRDYIRQVNANDSSCDQIYEGSGAITLKWGKV